MKLGQSIQKTAPVDETAEVFCGSKFTTTGEVFRIFRLQKTSPVVEKNPINSALYYITDCVQVQVVKFRELKFFVST